ncbi:DUF3302 domain-containing protein [Flammeovirga pectinis]|uniref:DUF3302 domain-containing protein n=1 Tax=Flammeovirga pectinis TaxID=2494373 RepID=A0A3Q9FRM0_9BACT|nr:DUF3302 domain-containing protein [Flammeovirga pectinis]AZQ63618.1 DUF3302 domain-containing protein [Flammeovirga pectinis]
MKIKKLTLYFLSLFLLLSTFCFGNEESGGGHGHTDTIAEVMSWVVLIILPPVFLTVFWKLHVIPEEIAKERNHPQADAIHMVCLLSLLFGGLLWPIALIWAYTRPSHMYVTTIKDPDHIVDHVEKAKPKNSDGEASLT